MNSGNSICYAGTSGLVLPVPKRLYPAQFQDKSRLSYYASLFNSVEINSSFYKMPMASTITKWSASAPVGFQFTFKLLKTITHSRDLIYTPADIEQFMQTIANAENKKGCLLVQFPPGVKVEKLNQFEKLLSSIQSADPYHAWKVAVEFRSVSWYHKEIYDLLSHHKASMVIHDLPGSAPPIIATTGFMYLRFHGPGGRYRGSYTNDFLHRYAQHIQAWLQEGKDVYAYFNNTMGDALKNVMLLNNFLKNEV